MSKIRQLDPHVANLIAAGEVVERPASVVKELVENSIDAGASMITVELQGGGMSLIRVTDNGCGMEPDDAATAFLRHATSKLRTEQDLEAIGSLGFRGEALAAIAAVSRVTVLTRVPGAPLGLSLSLEGGEIIEQEEAGCPEGTTMVVRDLFFNTPARLKFMKRDSAEGAAAFAVVQRLALSHPEVSIRFIRNGTQELLTPGDGQLSSALYSVLGRDLALGFTPVKGSWEDISVSGFVSMPACCRGSRGYQFFFVNGRHVRSRLMMAALEEAYKNQRMVGKFPGCVLHVNTRLSAVDVNVHPTKTEVKFQNESAVFDAVYYTVLSALEGETRRPAATLSASAPPTPASAPLMLHDSAAAALSPSSLKSLRTASPVGSAPVAALLSTRPQSVRNAPQATRQSKQDEVPLGTLIPPAAPSASSMAAASAKPDASAAPAGQAVSAASAPKPAPAAEAASPQPVQPEASAPAQPLPWRLAGEVFQTYILVEQGDKLLLIDKHAAHERMHFDRLKAQGYAPMSQCLLTPLVCSFPAEECAALLQHLSLLAEFGFEAESFGPGALLVRQVPYDIDPEETESTLSQLAEKLLGRGGADPAAARDDLLHTLACKAAIKGGWKSAPEELERVARAVLEEGVKYCPHGRPVAIEITRAQLERQFKRA